ncbi:hypothetical protein [Clostridium merdae]|uniref:hypothetical protein n=1 Tax=Clostridium merdae TaxID=1958780 RepID=UPI000A26E33C|nr:hypothetical protein [Clostridium merdae]
MTEKELYEYRGKNIHVNCTDGQVLSGFCCIVTQALDNDPEVASIVIERESGLTEIMLPEIESITVE